MRIHGYLAFLVGVCVTVWVCLFVMEVQDQQIRNGFQRDTEKVARDTTLRLQTYFDMLLSIKGVFAVSENLDRAAFHRYVRELNLTERYPGFQAIQFVRRVPRAQLAAYGDAIRRDAALQAGGYPEFKIHPASMQDEHFIIEYNEPMRGNENAFGLDLAALPTHYEALRMGRDNGGVIATERITLVQDASGQPGFVARLPVYRPGVVLDSLASRRAALIGFVAIVFRVNNLMREVIDSPLLGHLYVRINDGGYLRDGGTAAPSLDNLLFDSAGKAGEARLPALTGLSRNVSLNVGQRRWLLQFEGHAGQRYGRNWVVIGVTGAAGVIISALIAALLVAWQRRRALARELRNALNEQRAFQDTAVVGIGLFSNGLILRCNRGLEEMTGYPGGGLVGMRSSVLLRAGGAIDPFACGPCGEPAHLELELLRRDGSPLWCMVNGRRLDPEEPAKGCVWVIADISDRKAAEAALVETKQGLERSLAELAREKARVDEAHKELSSALAALKQAQATLITSEKMASLGALVAGIAHELNTPIGNSLLTVSALSDMVADFERKLAEGGIKRSTLDVHLADAKAACTIIAGSLGRAADLITSFKQVAVDQTSDQRRRFHLSSVLHDTLATYAAQLRRVSCEVKVDVPEALDFLSYPGSLSQVLSNLINNAILHAFEGRAQGLITITARAEGEEEAVLEFSDDGIGMGSKTLRQIYDPFFTTKMGQGGSGLGMNIVYNIVTGVLKGRIDIRSEPGQGTTVVLTLPRRVPARELEQAA
ncbi:CHASE domain-containing protein [Massilia sp. erpn]|uniref:CHASE domain-containing protein n=1 Tax=Massilia sp. erpn TaxID=2738142 RepID=UPI0021044741|nr:CHASE domain-containing protein [Massilia sp. erpn]UTY58082.1 PAS domain-containing protein [Massilia sp. erpn]